MAHLSLALVSSRRFNLVITAGLAGLLFKQVGLNAVVVPLQQPPVNDETVLVQHRLKKVDDTGFILAGRPLGLIQREGEYASKEGQWGPQTTNYSWC